MHVRLRLLTSWSEASTETATGTEGGVDSEPHASLTFLQAARRIQSYIQEATGGLPNFSSVPVTMAARIVIVEQTLSRLFDDMVTMADLAAMSYYQMHCEHSTLSVCFGGLFGSLSDALMT